MTYDNILNLNVNAGSKYLLLLLIPFFINPTLGLILAALLFVCSSQKREILIYFAFIIAIWISLVNVTKIPVSDQYRYGEIFRIASQLPFSDWWEIATDGNYKEPIFYIVTYCLNIIFCGNDKLYFFFLSFVNYFLLFIFSIKLSKSVNANVLYAVSSILVITFFTQYFTLTLHIIRQILAATIVMAAIISKAIDGKTRYLILICACTIHTSVGLLALLSLIPWFYRKLSFLQVVMCFGILIIFVILFGSIGSFFLSNAGTAGTAYVFSRMQNDAEDVVGQMSMLTSMTVLLPNLIVSLKLLFFDLPKKHYFLKNKDTSPFYPITYIFIIVSVFIIAMSKAPLIQYRFFMMSYVFIPYILPYLFYKKSRFYKLYLVSICIFFIIRFILIHNNGDFQYYSLLEISTLPLPMFFMSFINV